MAVAFFSLTYSGLDADQNAIDLYDVAEAMVGFQRSLALTTHFVLNGEVITQAPSLKGARILSFPPADGSWKVTAAILAGMYTLSTAPKDTPAGHLIRSAYDYVISQSLGFNVDYEKTLGKQYEEIRGHKGNQIPQASEERFDSVIEKCEKAIKDMHRPIIWSKTAEKCIVKSKIGKDENDLSFVLDVDSFYHINETIKTTDISKYVGRVSGYNINTFKGRIYVDEYKRTIPFELADNARDLRTIASITDSLQKNAIERMRGEGEVEFTAFRNESSTGRLKHFLVTGLRQYNFDLLG